jgi:hypothetical protein
MNGRRIHMLGAVAALAFAAPSVSMMDAPPRAMDFTRPEPPRLRMPVRKIGKKKRKKFHALDSANFGKPTRASRKWARKLRMGQMMWRP